MDAPRPAPAPAPESNRPKPPWHQRKGLRITLAIIAVLVVIAVVNNLRGSDTEQNAPTRERTPSRAAAAPTPLPARASRPTATRPPPTRAPRGIGVSRHELQSFFASPPAPFVFAPPDTLKDGRTRVSGMSPDGLAFLALIGPARDLQLASMSVYWPDL